MAKVLKMTGRSAPINPGQLATITEDRTYSDRVRTEIGAIAGQMAEAGLGITPGDILQLREVADLLKRAEDLQRLMDVALKANDVKSWAALAKQRDAQASIFRQLLADLRITRRTRIAGKTMAKDVKAEQKSGAGWEGLI